MRGTRGGAYQAAAMEKLRDENRQLRSELRTSELELTHRDKMIEALERDNAELKEQIEKNLFEYSERLEALYEAEEEYHKAVREVKELRERMKKQFDKQIAGVRRFSGKEAHGAVRK